MLPDYSPMLLVVVAGDPIFYFSVRTLTHTQDTHGGLHSGSTTGYLGVMLSWVPGTDRALLTQFVGRHYSKSFTVARWGVARDIWAPFPLAGLEKDVLRTTAPPKFSKPGSPSAPRPGMPQRAPWPLSQGGAYLRPGEMRKADGGPCSGAKTA